MVFGGLFGDSKDKHREQTEQEKEDEAIRMKAYHDAFETQRRKNAVAKGIADANRIANKKPFYQKVGAFAVAIGKDFASNPDKKMNALINFGEPPRQRRRKPKRRKHK